MTVCCVLPNSVDNMSLPVRECGLKCEMMIEGIQQISVTPRAGVWIEIAHGAAHLQNFLVTPRAGVWIEIGLWNVGNRLSCVTPCARATFEINMRLISPVLLQTGTFCTGMRIKSESSPSLERWKGNKGKERL